MHSSGRTDLPAGDSGDDAAVIVRKLALQFASPKHTRGRRLALGVYLHEGIYRC